MKKGINKGLEVPLFNHLATAAAVGLLMQPTAILNSNESEVTSSEYRVCVSREQSEFALSVIKDLTKKIHGIHMTLIEADISSISRLKESGDIDACMQIEMQIRSLEGVLRSLFLVEKRGQRKVVEPYYMAVVEAREAITNMNKLLSQASNPVKGYVSEADMYGLRALADHGTTVFKSENFH